MIRLAEQLNADVPACRFELNAGPDLSRFEAGTFDFTYSALVLQHMPTRELAERYLRELLRVTRGTVVVGVPDRIGLPYRLGVSRRAFVLLQRLGVSGDTLLRRTPFTPMRMSSLRESAVRAAADAAGAWICHVDRRDEGGAVTARYFVAASA